MDIKQSQRILDSIRRIVRALRVASRRAESRFGLSGAQLFVLQALRDGSSLTINELAERTYTHQSSVSTVVTNLEEAGLISRTRSRTDLRRIEVRITAKGKKILRMRIELGQSRLVAGIAKLPNRERALLAALLERLVKESGFSDLPARMFFEERKK
jgi:DNA-binding MarR family transcriptional regulator